jgi:hypothetical protein
MVERGLAWRRHLWLPLGALTLLISAYIYFWMPHQRVIPSLFTLLFKLLPFFTASLAIATLPNPIPGPKPIWAALPVLPLLGVIVPRMFYSAIQGFEASPSDLERLNALFNEFYTTVAMLVPYVFLWVSLAYRLGGGSPSGSLKLSIACLLVMLSGYEDIMLFIASPMGRMPEVARWAYHVTVFLGHPPSRLELWTFMAIHLLLAVLILAAPWDRVMTHFRIGRSSLTHPK